MKYFKFHIDEDDAKTVYCAYRDLSKGKSSPLLVRSFPIDLIGERETKIVEMVKGDITDVYYEEFNGEVRASEVKWFLGEVDSISDENIDWIKTFVTCACVEESYDDLIAPPSVDQQVEDFIKEFFEDDDLENLDNEKPLDQKDFLAEFFAELEEDSE
jgi:hypothetical protein